MIKRNLVGSFIMIGFLAMMPQHVIADDETDNRFEFAAVASRAQAVPAPEPGMIERARISARFNRGLSAVRVVLTVRGGSNVLAAHFHCALPGLTGPIPFGLFGPGPLTFDGDRAIGNLKNVDFTGADCVEAIGRPVNNIAALAFAMREGLIYVNVHTSDNAAGEVRAQMRHQSRAATKS